MAKLALVRHGKSEWNKLGLWTGQTQVELAPEGYEDARRAAEALRDTTFAKAYVSSLTRARQTLEVILTELKLDIPVAESAALNERDYGIYTGLNKWEVKSQVGEEEFQLIRCGWDAPIPKGERLKDVYERVVPYYETFIRPDLEKGDALVVAHGNSLRSLIKYIENLSDAAIADVELGVGEALVYFLDEKGRLLNKELRAANSDRV